MGGYPAWSPDGTSLVYAAWGGEVVGAHQALDDQRRRLRQSAAVSLPTANCDQHSFWAVLVWSPDGRQIAFSTTNPPGSFQDGTHVINADGAALRSIGPNSPEVAWQPIL